MTIVAPRVESEAHPTVVIGGVDTHSQIHHAAVLDAVGRLLATESFPASETGCRRLTDWLTRYGAVSAVGVECTGSYGAGLTRILVEHGITVFEVSQPDKQARARAGKDDRIDAIAAARAVLSGVATARPKNTTGPIEAIRYLHTTRGLLVKERTSLLNQVKDILITAPDVVAQALPATTLKAKAAHAARLRPDSRSLNDPAQAAKLALRTIGRQIDSLNTQIRDLDRALTELVAQAAPTLTSCFAVSTQHAAQLLVTAGQNIDRITSKAAFARLCGAAPIPASSGKTTRMRLHTGGDRRANRTLHMIVVCRLRYHEPTRDYMRKRTSQGLSKKDIIRCLKRYLSREIWRALQTDLNRLDFV